MAGIVVFPSVSAALSAGFEIYDKMPDGFLARIRTAAGWAFALVKVR